MKKHYLVFIFCFLFTFFKAQFKNDHTIKFPRFDSSASHKINFSFGQYAVIPPYSQNNNYNICIKSNLPRLPFFCGMEEKFRNKFNVFLKLRAGNDESYMRMITPSTK